MGKQKCGFLQGFLLPKVIRGQAPVSEGGIDFEGSWRDLGGEPKESPSLRGGIRKFDQF